MKAVVSFMLSAALLTGCATSDPTDDFTLRHQVQNESDTLAIAPQLAAQQAREDTQAIEDEKAREKAAGH